VRGAQQLRRFGRWLHVCSIRASCRPSFSGRAHGRVPEAMGRRFWAKARFLLDVMLPWLNPMGILAIAANCLATLDFDMDRAGCQLAWREKN